MLREIDEPVELHGGFSKSLTKFTHALDRTLPLVRGDAVHNCRDRVLGCAKRELDAHTIGIVGQVFEQLQGGLDSAGCFGKGQSVRSLLRRGLRVANRLRIVGG